MKTHHKFALLFGITLGLLLLGFGILQVLPAMAAGASNFYVDPTGDDAAACDTPATACKTIAGAIAKANAGDTIYLAAGTYTENVTVSKPLTFIGAGAGTTSVDGGGSGRVFDITGGAATVQALTLRNGNAGSGNGGALRTSSPLTLTGVTLSGSRAYWGGGLYAEADVVVRDSRFEGNTATGPDISNDIRKGGGGLYITGHLDMIDSDVIDNKTAGDGGGLSIRGNAAITGGTFARNTTTDLSIGSGAAIAITGDMIMSGTHVISNTAGMAGGAVVAGEQYTGNGGDVTVTNSRFEQNQTVRSSGGALYIYGNLTLLDSQFLTNTAATRKGAVSVFGDATIGGSLFQGNGALGSSDGATGAVDVAGAAVITGSTFLSNTAATSAGALTGGTSLDIFNSRFAGNRAGTYAGAIELYASLRITGTTFSGNRAGSYAGAIYNSGETIIRSSQFLTNTANTDGGALTADGPFDAEGSEFLGNTATTGNGGAAIIYNISTLRNVTLSGNNAANGGAIYNGGGALGVYTSTLASNTAGSSGGAIYNTDSGTLAEIDGSTLTANRANAGGAVFNDSEAAITLTNSSLIGNSAATGGGLQTNGGTATIVNTVLGGNGATSNGAAIYSGGSTEIQLTTIASPTVGANAAVYIAGGEATISSTIVASYTTGIRQAGGTALADYNLFFGNGTNQSGTVAGGGHNAAGDPRFVDPVGGDYQILGGSAALGVGVDEGIAVDLLGKQRADPPTAGAYERPATSAANDPYLVQLEAQDVPFEHPFVPTQLRNTASVPRTVTSTVVTPTASAPGAEITVNGTPVGSGSPSASIPLVIGSNTVTTVVTAQDGTTAITYTLAITRRDYDGPFYVDKTVGSDGNLCDDWGAGHACLTVGGAIAKSVLPGTFIYISGHTYTENLTVTLPLNFVGSGIHTTVIDGGQAGRVFNITRARAGVSLADLTVSGGRIASGDGGAIYAAGVLTLTNAAVINSSTGNGSGGGIYAVGALSLTNAEVMSNTAGSTGSVYGGGIYAVGAVHAAGGTLQNNLADTSAINAYAYGGALYAESTTALTGTRFVGNMARAYNAGGSAYQAQAFGGGAYVVGTLTVNAGEFLSNTAKSGAGHSSGWSYAYGGGVFAAGPATVTGGLFGGNGANPFLPYSGSTAAGYGYGYGGGLYGRDTLAVTGTRFVGNNIDRGLGGTATNDYRQFTGSGGGLYAAGSLVMDAAEFSGNTGLYTAMGYGAGAYAGGPADITGGLFQSNVLSFTADIGPRSGGYGYGAGLYADTSLAISGTEIISNANNAGAWYKSGGGGVFAAGGMVLTNARVVGNYALAGDGGGIYAGTPSVVTNSLFQENTAIGRPPYANAGAMLVRGPDEGGGNTTITGTRFVSNTTTGAGGALLLFGTSTDLNSSQFIANDTPDRGGALFLSLHSPLQAANLLFARNTAGTGPGLFNLSANKENVTLDYATFAAPTAYGGSAIVKEGDGTLTVHNSIFANYATSLQWSGGTLLSDYNLFFNAPTSENPGDHSLLDVDPLFVNPQADNYQLLVGSPASAAGTAVGGVTTDINGKTRGDPPTMGAYEGVLDLDLSSLQLSSGTLTPDFTRATTRYSARVGEATATIVVTPTASSPTARLSVNGSPVASGTGTQPIALTIGANPITVTVTGPDGVSTKQYMVAVTRTGADLLDLVLSSGPLTPPFVRSTTAYTAAVPNIVRTVTLTPTAADGDATIAVNGTPVPSGTATQPITLVVGANVITTVVTAPGGTPVKTYVITITRPPSSDAGVTNLALTTGVLSPVYTPATTEYTAAVANGITRTAVLVTASEENARITVNGTPVTSGSPSPLTDLIVGDNVFRSVIVAQDSSLTNTYTITVTRAPLDLANANLANLVLGPVALNPAFAVGTIGYTATVPFETTSATITPTVGELTATVTVKGTPVASGAASAPLPLLVGVNNLPVLVTAPNGATQRTYTVAVTRDPWKGPFYVDPTAGSDTNPCESWGAGHACATIAGAVGKAVLPNTTIYLTSTVHTVASVSSSLSLNFVGAGKDSTIINGTSGSRAFNMTGGSTNVTFRDLTVQNASLTSGNGAAINAAGTLSLTNVGILSNTTSSGAGAGIYAVGALTLTNVTVQNNTASGSGGGVNAQNGAVITESTFIRNQANYGGGIYVVNTGFEIANSQFISNSAGTKGGGAYVQAGPGTVMNSLFQGNTAGDGAAIVCQSDKLTVDGSRFVGNTAAYSGGGIYLDVGRGLDLTNTLFAGNTAGTAGAAFMYGALSGASNANVRFVTISSPAVGANSAMAYANISLTIKNSILTNYTDAFKRYGGVGSVTLDYNLYNNIGLTGETTGTHSIGSVDPLFFDPANGNYHLKAGSRAIDAGLTTAGVTTDLDGSPRDTPPTIGAYEGAFYPYDVNLVSLQPSSGTLSPDFTPKGTRYTSQVGSSVTSIILTPVASSPAAAIAVDGQAVTSGSPSQAIPLQVGANVITTSVTATDTVTVKNYVVTVTRLGADLANLVLSSGPLTPSFARATTAYTSTAVANLVTSVTVTPTAADGTATITVNGTPATSGAQSSPVALNVGENTLTILVTADGGAAVKSYTIKVVRLPSSDANLINLVPAYGTLAPTFISSTVSYAVAVGNGITSITLSPTANEPNATITVDGSPVASGGTSAAIPLVEGQTPITTVVTAEDGVVTKTYVTTVTRAAVVQSNATLANLVPGSGTLTPGFAAATYYYATSVPYVVASMLVTPTANELASTLTVNNQAHTSGTGFGPVSLTAGAVTTVTTAITAPDGTTSLTYVLAITRRPWEGPFYVDGATGDNANACDTWGAGRACRTIGGAIAKSSLPGTTIYIAPGTFTENLTATLPLNFVGAGASSTVVDGGGVSRVFNITATTGVATFQDLTVRNGRTTGDGAGINAAGMLSLTNVSIISSTAGANGGGVYAAKALTLTNTSIISNTSSSRGGGVYANAVALVQGGLFQGNAISVTNGSSTGYGGGLYAGSSVIITGTQFLRNRNAATSYSEPSGGGGLYASATAVVTNTQFLTNTAAFGDGGGAYGTGTTEIYGCVFQGNTADAFSSGSQKKGGGLAVRTGPATITGTRFSSNKSWAGSGAAIWNGAATVTNSQFIDNPGVQDGGGLFINGGLGQGSNLLFVNNTGNYGAALYYVNGSGTGEFNNITISSPTVRSTSAIYKGYGGAMNVKNTIVHNYTTAFNVSAGTVTSDYNLYYNTGSSVSIGTHSITGTNPLFANPGGGDYRLQVGSPATAKGTAIAGITTDLDGKPRSTPPSIGAYEGSPFDVDLRSLQLSKGSLTPVFTNTVRSYTAQVAYSVQSVTITSTSSSPTATLKLNGQAVVSGTESQPIALLVGPNLITTTVSSPNGIWSSNYVVTVNRVGADLANLTLSSGPLNPLFARDTTFYTATVPNSTGSVSLTPTAADGSAAIKVDGVTVASGSASGPIPLLVGTNTITTVVSARDGVTTRTYIVEVTRLPALSSLALTVGALTPSFAAGTPSYTSLVGNGVDSTAVIPTSTDAGVQITVNGVGVSSGTPSSPIALVVGQNPITTVIAAGDGSATATYIITVTRGPAEPGNATLSDLVPSTGGLNPGFTPPTVNYTSSVPYIVTSMTITPTASELTSTLAVNNEPIVSGEPSQEIGLAVGPNPITTVITAPDGLTTLTYTLTVTRRSWEGPFYVEPTGSNTNQCDGWGASHACQTIAGAIAKATLPGTTIYITGTTFTENLAVTRPLNFVGAGVNNTIIDGGLGGRVFNITGATSGVSLQDLTVQRGSVTGSGAGIYAAGPLTLTNVNVLTSTATNGNGGGIYAAAATSLSGVTLRGNTATSASSAVEGGGLYALAPVRIDNGLFQGNTATGNSSNGRGGGLSVNGASATVSGSQFLSNTAAVGGGAYVITGTAALTATQFTANRGTVGGGGLYLDGGPLTGANLLLARNTSPLGAGIVVTNTTGAGSLAYTTIVSPTATSAAAVYQSGGTLDIQNSIVTSYTLAVQAPVGTVTSDFNLFYNAGIVDSMGAHSITSTNPLFMNQAGDNYRLAVGSPAIRKGTAVAGITTDLRGAPRGNPPTIGAYEGTGVDVDLRSLAPTYGSLAPVFAPTTLVYTSGVPNEVTNIAVVATTSDPAATIKVNGRTVVSGTASRPVDLAIGANTITTTVTAPGGAVTQSYILTVTRASVPVLTGLALSVNPINPDFARGTFAYTTAIVPNLAASTLVTAVAGSLSDVVSVAVAGGGGAAATCSGTTPSCPLAVGDNTITVTVTAADASSQVYTVAVPRAAPPTLSELQLSAGTLAPAFISSTLTYSIAAVANPTANTLVTATATSATDTISITAAANGGSATSCTGTTPSCPLAVGTNVISVTVTGPGDSKRVYKVTVPRAGDGSLTDLALSAAPIQPAFVTTTLAYSTELLPYTATSTIVTATTQPGDVASVVVAANGGAASACPGTQPLCPLAAGVNVITTTVTAIDSSTRTYVVTVPRQSDVLLSDLALSVAPIQPAFITTTQLYTTAALPYSASSTLVTATAAYAGDTVSITVAANGGTPVLCVGTPAACSLAVGQNVVQATVTPTAGTPRVYTITTTRAGDTRLVGLAINPGTLAPAFISTTLAYTAAVTNASASTLVTVTAGPGDTTAVAVAANGGAPGACSGTPLSCPLAVGVNVITATITAADSTVGTYTVTVTRARPALLASLATDPVVFSPVFSPTTYAYTATAAVANVVANTLVTATSAYPADVISITVTPNGGTPSACTGSPVACPLAVGTNVIDVKLVTSEGSEQDYTVAVARYSDAALQGVAVSAGALNPVFGSTTLSYTTAMVGFNTGSTLVTATAAYADDAISITVAANGGTPAACTGAPVTCPLAVGANRIDVAVTSASSAQQIYTVAIKRANNNADLTSLILSQGTLVPDFGSGTITYTAGVTNVTASLTLTPTVADPNATIKVNGIPVSSGAPAGPLALDVGENTITIVVTAEDATVTKTYTVTVTRAEALGGVEGVVFDDRNANGVQDAGENGVANVTVELWQNGAVAATCATDGGGVYRFADLAAGGRVVRITVPAGFAGSTVEQAINVAPGVTVRSANFALRELGSVAGMIFEDLDGSGRQESGEPGVGGMTVDLLAGSTVVQTTGSDGTGLYRFAGVTAGSYVLRMTLGADYVAVLGSEQAIDLAPGSEAGGYSFGVQRKGSLTGTIYHDRNGNDRVDPGEQGIGGVTVTLVDGGGSSTAQTDANGRYVFSNLLPGLYQVQIPALGGWIANGAQAVSVNLGSSGAAIASFGFQAQGAIGGVVFQDMDGDAVQSDGEAGVAGVAVQVLQNANVITTTTSGADGSYSVGGLTPGAYLLRLLVPGGFAPVTPVEREVLLADGGAVNGGFGLEPLSTIAGSVYEDANGDGVRQAYEQGLGSVPVTIFTAGPDGVFNTDDDVQAGTQSTAGDGTYQFLDQALNAYSVRVAALGSYTGTTPSRVVVNLAQGWVAAANFGLQATSSVAGMTFEDLNGSGARDPGEPPLAGLPMLLVPAGATREVVANGEEGEAAAAAANSYSATTGSQGSVVFRDVPPGTYELQTAPPDDSYVAPRTVATVVIPPNGVAGERFGFQQVGTVTGAIYDDADGDGVRTPGEGGLGGVVVALLDAGGGELSRQVTAGDGSYRFGELAAGSYQLSITPPSGYAPTSANPAPFTIAAGGTGAAAAVSTGVGRVDSVGGRVFSDLNKNGIQDPGEPGVAGTIVMLRQNGAPDHTVKTAVSGLYLFTAAANGTYEVLTALPPNFVPITPLAAAVTVDGTHAPAARFAIRPNLPNQSPVVQGLPDVTKKVGDSVHIQVVAHDPDDAVLVYSATGLPAGLTIDEATGLITGQLPPGSAGSYAVTVTATDTLGASGQATFNFTVEEPEDGWGLYFPQICNGVEANRHLYFPAVYR